MLLALNRSSSLCLSRLSAYLSYLPPPFPPLYGACSQGMDDEDLFSDVDFDELPPGTLLQLEQNAYHNSQAAQQISHPPSARLAEPPPQNNAPQELGQSHLTETSLKPPQLHTGITNEYADLDVGELDAEVLEDDTGSTSALGQALVFAEQHASQQQSNLQHGHAPVVEDDYTMYEEPTGDPMDEDEEARNAPDALMQMVTRNLWSRSFPSK